MRCSNCDAYRGTNMSNDELTAKRERVWSHLGTVWRVTKVLMSTVLILIACLFVLSGIRGCTDAEHKASLQKREAALEKAEKEWNDETCHHVVTSMHYSDDPFHCPSRYHSVPKVIASDNDGIRAWVTCECKGEEQ